MPSNSTELFTHIGKAPQEDDITMLTLQRRNPSFSTFGDLLDVDSATSQHY